MAGNHSFVTYPGDGNTKNFALSFTDGYFQDSHVVVTVDGLLKVAGTDYTIDHTPATPEVLFTTAPVAGTTVKLERQTPSNVAAFSVDFQDQASITEAELDLSVKHLLFLLQEANDNAEGDFIKFDSVLEVWQGLQGGAIRELRNLKDPQSPQSAATQKYVDDVAQFGVAGVPLFFELNSGAGADTSYTLTGLPGAVPNSILVWVNGAIQRPTTDYTTAASGVSNTQLDLVGAPPPNADIFVFNIGSANVFATFTDGTIEGSWLKTDTITGDKIATGAVGSAEILDGAVDSAEIASAAVTETKIADASITDSKLKTTGFSAPLTPAGTHFIKIASASGTRSVGLLTASEVSDLAAVVKAYKLNEFAAPNASVSFGGQKLTSLGTPSAVDDGATKDYVDTAVGSATVARDEDQSKGGATSSLTVGAWTPPSKLLYYKVYFQFKLDAAAAGTDTLYVRVGDDDVGLFSGGSDYRWIHAEMDGTSTVHSTDLTDSGIKLGTLDKDDPLVGEFLIGAARPLTTFSPDGWPQLSGRCAGDLKMYDIWGSLTKGTNDARTGGSKFDRLQFYTLGGKNLSVQSRVSVFSFRSA